MFSYYAACKGEKEVICLEPELLGSSEIASLHFQKIIHILNLKNIFLHKVAFQAFDSRDKYYDLVLLYNSINNLDEAA